MTNADRLVGEVAAFVEKARGVGIYNPSQITNMNQALKLAFDQARALGVDVDKLSVGEATGKLSGWLDEYGRNSKAGVQSIATYAGRGKKVLEDFAKWNGGDFMEWKKTIAKSPRPVRKVKPKDALHEPSAGETGEPAQGEQIHLLRLPGGVTGRLILPQPISTREISAAWKQLDAYKTLLETQASIDAGTDEDETDET